MIRANRRHLWQVDRTVIRLKLNRITTRLYGHTTIAIGLCDRKFRKAIKCQPRAPSVYSNFFFAVRQDVSENNNAILTAI